MRAGSGSVTTPTRGSRGQGRSIPARQRQHPRREPRASRERLDLLAAAVAVECFDVELRREPLRINLRVVARAMRAEPKGRRVTAQASTAGDVSCRGCGVVLSRR